MFEAIQQFQNGVPELSATALFFLLFIGTFISEDAACIAAGAAVANGKIEFIFAFTACFLGIFAGDLLLYAAGRALGPRVFENRFVRRFVSDGLQKRALTWFEKNGLTAVFLSRFVTGFRLPTYLAAGAFKADIRKFSLYLFLASAIWTPIILGAATVSVNTVFKQNIILGIAVLFVVGRLALKLSSYKGRRLFMGRFKRITNWEFWPLQAFYIPVVCYVAFLAARHRSLTAFAAANPAIPGGGFKGESKDDIYRGLIGSDAARPFLLRHLLIEKNISSAERILSASRFIEQNNLSFPLASKPNAGERGKNVRIMRSYADLETSLADSDQDLILQEFADGEEVSIFYYRRPTESHGHIFSITEKRFPVVVGDSRSTLEELILADPRAVCLAEKYFEQNAERLGSVPIKGECVRLIGIGTHSRGAIFLDGGWLKTEMLEAKIDEICRGYKGFYFGRFDIRVPSFADLQRGENFKIIELNGVTSESTNIYDPRYSLFDAYRILFHQWRLAFEIGSKNIRLGTKKTNVSDLFRMAFHRDDGVAPYLAKSGEKRISRTALATPPIIAASDPNEPTTVSAR